jgi:DNA-directed RNA polymerase
MGSDPFRTQLRFEQSAPMEPHMEEFCYALADAADVSGSALQRVNWCAQHHEQIRKVGTNPLDYRAFWEGKKNPWRFVELALEYECWCDDRSYETRSIFQLDQCTSAYGHVACLLRSDYLAGLTNVIGHQKRDIYTEVGNRAYELMTWRQIEPALKHELYSKRWWLDEFGDKRTFPRELIKPLVMPLVYRISYQTMVEEINDWLTGKLKNFLNSDGIRTIDLAHTLARYVHAATKEILPGIGALHKWLCAVAKIQMKQNLRPYWVTPNGLGVESYSTKKSIENIYLEVSGRNIRCCTKADDTPEGMKIDVRKSTSQLSADFCHSHDAAFIQRFIWHWGHTYKKPIVTIHDCAGTTLDNVALMRRELPDQFNRYYSEDYLGLMHRQLEKELKVKIPAPPMEHSLQVDRIGENPYLFT